MIINKCFNSYSQLITDQKPKDNMPVKRSKVFSLIHAKFGTQVLGPAGKDTKVNQG